MSSLNLIVPASGTLAFPTTKVGEKSQGAVTLQSNLISIYYIDITSMIISGAGAAAYSILSYPGRDAFSKGFLGHVQSTDYVQFAPHATGSLPATLVIAYDVATISTDHVVTSGTITITLTGNGGPGGPTGEAPAMLQSFRRELVPVNGISGIVLGYFDETTFDDALDSSTYIFKVEDILANRVPTVRRVVLTYVDLGVATLKLTINGSNDNGALVTASTTVTIGNTVPTGLLLTKFVDIAITCFRPQLTITRQVGGGPLQISTVLITGMVEQAVTL